MVASRYEQAIGDVAAVFSQPGDITDADDLSRVQKIDLLQQWECDLLELIEASGEGMNSPNPGEASQRLRTVREMLAALDAPDAA